MPTGGAITSDAGALLLGETDRAIRLTERFAVCFTDARVPELVEHEVGTMVAHAGTLRQRTSDLPRQDDIGCLVERSADARIADLGDPSCDIRLARLILLWRQSKMCANSFGGSEPRGIVDRCHVGQRDKHTDTWGGHQ